MSNRSKHYTSEEVVSSGQVSSRKTTINRRSFLKHTGTAVAGLSLPFGIGGCDQGEGSSPTVEALAPPPPPTGVANVGIVRRKDVEEMVRAAVELAGGLGDIKSGDTVVLKPNITSIDVASNPKVTTTPSVMQAVIRMVKERTGARNITMAEASAFGMATRPLARQTGLLDVINSEGINFLAWETQNYVTVRLKSPEYLNFDFRIPESLHKGAFDHFINVPILKNHEMVSGANVDYTCAIKLQVGTMHSDDRLNGGADKEGIHTNNLGEMVAELNLAVPKVTMNIVDALSIVLTGGPGCGKTAAPGLIIASKDRVAADSVAVALLRHHAKLQGIDRPYVNKSVWDQAQIRHAQKLNLGRRKENISVLDDGVDDINAILAQWA